MKSLYKLFSLALLCISFSATSQTDVTFLDETDGVIHLQCTVGGFHTANVSDGVVIRLDGGTTILRSGSPDLPKLTEAIIVDDTRDMNIEVVYSEYAEYDDVNIIPSKGNMSRTVDPNTVAYTYGEAYNTNAFYPGQLASLDEAYVQGQFRAQSLHFYPVQYNPVTHVMRVYSTIEVNIIRTENVGINPLQANVQHSTNATMRDVYASRFINYSANAERYEAISEIGSMLVIYDEEYLDELEPWIQWKKEKGIEVNLMDVATINSVALLGNYVADYYNENGLTYLVLVGDEDQVPSELVNNSGGQGYCDPCYGYISGNDNYSEIFIGRFLVHNDEELPAVISKVLEYEKNPNLSTDWFSVAMGLGSNEGDGIGDEDQADWQHNNGIKEELLDYTYTQVWEKYDGNHTAASPTGGVTADASGNPTNTSLTEVIENGCSLINYTGHGAHSLIVTGNYTNTQINQLDNHGFYPFFIVVGCCTGDFDDDDASGDTFGEAWLKCPSGNYDAPTGGIGGAFSSVYQSWAPPMEGQDEMNKVIAATSEAGNTRHTLGSIHYHGCHGMNDEYGADGDEMTDTWILMGDPTIQLRTAYPTQITASHPATLFLGANELSVTCDTEEAMVAVTMNGEIITTGIISGGNITLSFSALTIPGELLVTISSFNTIPYQQTIDVVPADGPYVINDSNILDDEAGNNNGEADYNESILLDVTAGNIGIETAFGVTGILACSNASIVITDNTYDFGDIAANSSAIANDGYAFYINGYILDQTIVTFTITYTDSDGNVWTSTFTVTINAPNFVCGGDLVINELSGNDNGRLDSGEMAEVSFPVTNNGHAASAIPVSAWLTEYSDYLTINSSPVDLGIVAEGQTVNATFTVEVLMSAPANEQVDFDFSTTSDYYSSQCDYTASLNQTVEDWETGTSNGFEWVNADDADWFTTTSNPYEGLNCKQSGNVDDNEITTLQITIQVAEADEISFSYRVSSEADWDYLQFFIGNAMQDEWSGDIGWTEASFPIGAGTRVLKWKYMKDEYASDGSDAAWVDNIIFPPMVAVSIEEQTSASLSLEIYPNPAGDNTTIAFTSELAGNVAVTIENMLGEIVFSTGKTNTANSNHRININTAAWSSGMYIVHVTTPAGSSSEKMMKR